jgi:hypothetical protein
MAEANKSQRPINPTITACAKVILDRKDLAITDANVNPMCHELVYCYIGTHKILRICGNLIKLDLSDNMTIQDTVKVSRLMLYQTANSKASWYLLPPPVRTSQVGTSYFTEPIANHRASSDRTGWEYEVRWEGWNEKDITWEPEENITKAKVTVKQYGTI